MGALSSGHGVGPFLYAHRGRMELGWSTVARTCFPPESETCTEDLDGDGLVSVADLLMVLGAFGPPCQE